MTDLSSRVGDFEYKRRNSSSSIRDINEKRNVLVIEGESDNSIEDSHVDKSNEETSRLPIPDMERPSTSKELDKLLSDGELDTNDESEDDILKDLKSFFKWSEKSGPAYDKELAEVVNEVLRSVKRLREKFIRPSNVDTLHIPQVESVIWHSISDKGTVTDAAVQKTVSKLMPGLMAIVQPF